jgi:hypothetical protein
MGLLAGDKRRIGTKAELFQPTTATGILSALFPFVQVLVQQVLD